MKIKIIPLDCKCHGVCERGFVYTKLRQISKKGMRGFSTILTKHWKKLSSTLTKKGYYQVNIHGKILRVNRIIASVFLKNPNKYTQVQHINGNSKDNRVKNLKWGTPQHNCDDKKIHGTAIFGSKSKMAKLNEEKVIEIKKLLPFKTLQSIANVYNVSKKLILLIKQNKIWRHV